MPPICNEPAPLETEYRSARLRVIGQLESEHFWFVPRRRRLLNLVRRRLPGPARVLDVGCGTGGFCGALRRLGHDAVGLDPHAAEMGLPPGRFYSGTSNRLPFPDAHFDAVCIFDVLEHVDDAAALKECRRVLRPGGQLFLSVPAYASLWSQRDTVAGHRRRYNRPMLRSLLRTGGFDLHELSGYQFFLLPLIWWNRSGRKRAADCVAREDQVPPALNRLLRWINELEVSIASTVWAPPLGSSLVAAARRP
jgi:SAM-dependent methyltransferase